MNDSDLAEEYWADFRRSNGDRAERLAAEQSMAATEEINERVRLGTEGVVSLLVEIAGRSPDPRAESLAYLGAGPIEDLLINHAERLQNQIDAAARRSERFRAALRCAWFDDSIDPSIAQRLRRFGDPL